MKRMINVLDGRTESSDEMANCLMLLSHGSETDYNNEPVIKKLRQSGPKDVFECKTCNRKFPSFQALGGHRASHRARSRISIGEDSNLSDGSDFKLGRSEAKMHKCSICGLEFKMGQALGGHMRKHKADILNNGTSFSAKIAVPVVHHVEKLPLLRRSCSSKRRVCLDLNLTPLENDLKLLFGNMAPKVDLCI